MLKIAINAGAIWAVYYYLDVYGKHTILLLGFELVPYSFDFDPPEEVTIDKPFIFVIMDTALDTIIFAGCIKDPSQDGSPSVWPEKNRQMSIKVAH